MEQNFINFSNFETSVNLRFSRLMWWNINLDSEKSGKSEATITCINNGWDTSALTRIVLKSGSFKKNFINKKI